jgi:hypothetical protein
LPLLDPRKLADVTTQNCLVPSSSRNARRHLLAQRTLAGHEQAEGDARQVLGLTARRHCNPRTDKARAPGWRRVRRARRARRLILTAPPRSQICCGKVLHLNTSAMRCALALAGTAGRSPGGISAARLIAFSSRRTRPTGPDRRHLELERSPGILLCDLNPKDLDLGSVALAGGGSCALTRPAGRAHERCATGGGCFLRPRGVRVSDRSRGCCPDPRRRSLT